MIVLEKFGIVFYCQNHLHKDAHAIYVNEHNTLEDIISYKFECKVHAPLVES